MFPTRFRSKISHTLSYPVSAKELTEALGETPQADKLTIQFSFYRPMKRRGKPYEVLAVRYVGDERVTVSRGYADQWSISVSPVPRSLRHSVNTTLKEVVLPVIRQWLDDRKSLTSQFGAQSITALFDEKTEALTIEHDTTSGEAYSM
jgi:hypothetical protein